MLHSFSEDKIAFLLHPLKMKSLPWLWQMSSGAQNGELEPSLSESLSENPFAAVYFHIHIRRLAFGFLFFTRWWDWSALWKKHQTSVLQSPQFLGACRENSQTRIYHTSWWLGRSERCFIGTKQRSSLAGDLPGLLPWQVSLLLIWLFPYH